MSTAASSVYVAVGTPILSIREGIFETSFYGYPIELTLPGVCVNACFVRRYSDFESLRNQLRAEHWDCIVAPIPEKETLQGKLSTNDTDHGAMLEHRRIALRRFLLRVAHHPILGASPLLAKFTVDKDWRECLRRPLTMPPFLAVNLAEDFVKALQSGGRAGTGDGTAYLALLNPSAGLDAEAVDGLDGYIARLETALRGLRDRLHALALRRRAAGEALGGFARALGRLTDGEDDAALRGAIATVHTHTEGVAAVYRDQAESDLQKIVSTLGYYVGMCTAVRQTLASIWAAMNELRALGLRVQCAEAKVAHASAPNLEAAQNSLALLTGEKMHREREMQEVEKTFKEEFCRFHREKQYDMRELLKVFGELQLAFSSNLRNKWEGLRPFLKELAS